MHEITTIKTIDDLSTTEVCRYAFDTQEEIFEFLTDFASMEASELYDALKKCGDRTTVLIEPSNRKAMSRKVSGTTRRDGRKPVNGSVTITVQRVA